ncbi:hypothetical protein D3Z50_21965 [Clostridiaceae bacterium]|nr:hypothetical protein [Clostridiaceae bacterium]
MGLFSSENIKTSMFLVEGLPSSFKAVIRVELDKKAQKLLFKLPQEDEFRELPFSQILYARREQLIDKQKDLNGLSLKINYNSKDGTEKSIVLLYSPLISSKFNKFAKEIEVIARNQNPPNKTL